MKPKSSPRFAAFALLAPIFCSFSAYAADHTWTGATDTTWNTTSTNWNPATPDAWNSTNGGSNKAIFNGATVGTINLGAPVFANALQFDTTGYTIANGGVPANTLTLAGTTPTITTGTSVTATIGANVAGTSGLTKEGAGTLVFSSTGNTYNGAVTVNAGVLQLGNGTGTVANHTSATSYLINPNGTLRLSVGASSAPVWTKFTGDGTLALKSAASGDFGWGVAGLTTDFTGTLQIEGGRVVTNSTAGTNNYGLGAADTIVVTQGGQLGLNLSGAVSFGQNFILSGTGYGEAGFQSAIRMHNATLSGSVTLAGNTTLGSAGSATIDNGISESTAGSALTVGTSSQAGTLTLKGANTYTGGTTIAAGTLQLGNGGTTGSLSTTGAIVNNGIFRINRSNAVTQGTDFSGAGITGTGSFVQAGTGTTTLNAANTYTGTTTINGGGTLKVTGSISSANTITVGNAAAGVLVSTLDISGGTVSTSSNSTFALCFGNVANAAGAFTMSSGALNLTHGTSGIVLGNGSATTWTQTGGAVTHSGTAGVYIANATTGPTDFSISDGSFTTASSVYLGVRAAATMTISNTAQVSVAAFNFGLTGTAGGAGAHILNLNGGRLTSTNGLAYTASSGAYTANLNGGTLQAGASTFAWANHANVTATIGASGVTFDSQAFNATTSQILGGTGGLTKIGSGKWTLSGINSYAGATTIKAGTLELSGSGSIASSSIVVGDAGSSGAVLDVATISGAAFTVGASQTVSGIGAVNAGAKTVTVGGALAPGNSAGTLSISTTAAVGLQFLNNGSLNIELTRGLAPAAGTNYDQLGLNGTLSIDSGADLNLSALGTGSYALNSIYFLISNDGSDAITGEFQGFTEGGQITFDGQLFNVTYDANYTGVGPDGGTFNNGNDFALMAVPEPNVAALLGGMGMLALLRRRR